MKITRISVNNLFGIFNHDIPLNVDDKITIIHGPNGFGKTVLLTMLNDIFNSRFREFRRIPFDSFSVEFDDNSNIRIRRIIKQDSEKRHRNEEVELIFELTKYRQSTKYHTLKTISGSDLPFPLSLIEREISGLDRVGPQLWIYLPTQEKLSLDEVLDRFGSRLPIPKIDIKVPEWLSQIIKSIPVRFIETQRLLSFSYPRRVRDYEGRPPLIPAVVNYSDELTNAIQEKLAEYATISQSLDRNFPTRLVKGSTSSELTIDELKYNLNELEEKRSRLMAAGLLDKEKELDFKELQKIDETNRNVLSVYIEDVKKKLSVFDELTNKIDLFVKLINNRFLYKQMAISKKDGFIFTTIDDKPILPSMLSSGEQHELVLLYELLFKVNPNSLILIDEPELSLHVVWQQQFLKDLQEITTLAGFDVLIATHSPQIIHNRWDLTVELRGPKNE